MSRVVVVGAGISGLTLAYRLQQLAPADEVVVLEQGPRPGGTIGTLLRDGYLVEAGPNGFPDNNPATLDLSRELGLADQLVPASEEAARNRFLFLGGRLHRLPNTLTAFLGSDLLSWVAKLRLLTERYRPRGPSRDAEESIDAFARRRVGGEVARTLVDAFVTGILAGDPKLLSAQAAFPRVTGWERDHGSVLKGLSVARRQRQQQVTARSGSLWSFREGLLTLVTALAARLGGAVLLGVSARQVRRDGGRWLVEADGHPAWTADAVVLTCPAHRQADLLSRTDPGMADLLAGIPYNRVAVVALGYRREDVPHPLDGFGYLSPQRERRDVLGVQWCSSIYPDRAPPGRVLLRAMCGGWHRGEMLDWPDDRLVAAVRAELALSLGARAAPVFTHITRWGRAIPQYHVGHLARLDAVERRLEQHPGLFLGGNAFRGVAMNDCVEQAGLLAVKIQRYLAGAGVA